MRLLPNTRGCFVCGSENPLGFQLRFESDGQIVQSRFVPKPEHAGFKDTVHGGLLATVLDEAMEWACGMATRRFSYCAELNVRFLHPAHPSEELRVEGKLIADRRGRIYEAAATITNAGQTVIARATGKYIPLSDAETAQALLDFGENAGELW